MDPDVERLFREFRRIGFEPEDVPVLAITVPLEEFFSRLRAIPDGAGLEAFEALLRAMPKPEDPEWNVCPGLGPLFTPAEWHAAFLAINGEPTHLVESVARRQDRTVYELALLCHVSGELAARVDAYRAELRALRVAAGKTDVVDRADAAFEEWRTRHGESLADRREQEARDRGPIVWFRLAADVSSDAIDAIESEVRDHATAAWYLRIARDGHPGHGIARFREGVAAADVERVREWLERHPNVADVVSDWDHSGAPWIPAPRWDPDEDEED